MLVYALALLSAAHVPSRFAAPGARACTTAPTAAGVHMGYVPDGLTKEQYEKIKKKEREAQANLGATGTNRFQSRSMYAFQKALERGEATHLFPVSPEKVKKGEIKLEDVPYMQRRGGRWDQTDVKGAKKRNWNKWDEAYEKSGRGADASVSIFGGDNLPWTSKSLKGMSKGPDAEMIRQWKRMGVKVDKNGNPITAASAKAKAGAEAAPKKKGLFGLF